jgi:hypothetical protein
LSSHEEKWHCLKLSMGGQPWPELELHGRRPRGLVKEEGEGDREGRGGCG